MAVLGVSSKCTIIATTIVLSVPLKVEVISLVFARMHILHEQLGLSLRICIHLLLYSTKVSK